MIIGLTGNIGSGKSTAAHILAGLGAAVIDADEIGHQVLLPDGPAYAPVLEYFGREFLDEQGRINRKKLGAYVFAEGNETQRQKLNTITHPFIFNEIHRLIENYHQNNVEMIVLEAALLLTTPLREMVDEIWVISAPLEILLARVLKRDGSTRDSVKRRLKSQLPQEKLIEQADRVIVNNGDISSLATQLKAAYRQAEMEKR